MINLFSSRYIYTNMRTIVLVIIFFISVGSSRLFSSGSHNKIDEVQDSISLLSDQDIIAHMFEGIFNQNHMQGPFIVKYCFTKPIDHQTVTYINDALQRASRASAKDLVQLVQETIQFFKSLPYPFYECMVKDPQMGKLVYLYDIDPTMDFQALILKLSQYFTLHFLQVHKWSVDLNDKWKDGNYVDTGYTFAIHAHTVQHWLQSIQNISRSTPDS